MKPELAQVVHMVTAAVGELTAAVVPDQDIPDLAGQIRKIETDLAVYRRGLTSELEAGTHVGAEYQIRVPSERVHTYNPPAIIAAVASGLDGSIAAAIQRLLEPGAMRVTFVYTLLDEVVTALGVELREVRRELSVEEIGDLDAPAVGTYWRQGTPVVEAAGKEPFRKKGAKR